MTHVLLMYNARLLDEAIDEQGALLIVEGKIRAVFQGYFTGAESARALAMAILKEDGCEDSCHLETYDARGLTVTPAFVDMHSHFRDPGQTDKEDIESGLRAAASGGFGTVVAMPNTEPVISSAEAAIAVNKRAAALGLSNFIQAVSITEGFDGESMEHIAPLDAATVPIISEDGRDVQSAVVMFESMAEAADNDIIVSCHCEDPELAAQAVPLRQRALRIMERNGMTTWGTGTPLENLSDQDRTELSLVLIHTNRLLALAENIATKRNIALAREGDCHIHICHVSTAEAVNTIRAVKQELKEADDELAAYNAAVAYDAASKGTRFTPTKEKASDFAISCEVTPHHLALCGLDDPYLHTFVNPPLRSAVDRGALLKALRDGTIDCIATDHAPHTIDDKAAGAPGFTGFETAYAVCNTVLVKEGQINAKMLSKLMSANPARILGLNKGLLRAGYDGDLAVTDPDKSWTVNPDTFYSKGKATPFEGRVLTGSVEAVFIAGKKIFERK